MSALQAQLEWFMYMRERPIVVVNGFPVDLPLNHSYLLRFAREGAIAAMRPGSCANELSVVFARRTDACRAWSNNFEVPYDESQPTKKVRCYLGRTVKYLPAEEQFDSKLDTSLRYFFQPKANIHDARFLPRGFLESDVEHKERWAQANPLAAPRLGGGPPRPQPQTQTQPTTQSLPQQLAATHIQPSTSSSSSADVHPSRARLPPQSSVVPSFERPDSFAGDPPLAPSGRIPLPPQQAIFPGRSDGARFDRIEQDQGIGSSNGGGLSNQYLTHSSAKILPVYPPGLPIPFQSASIPLPAAQALDDARSLSTLSNQFPRPSLRASLDFDNYENSILSQDVRQKFEAVPILRGEAAIYTSPGLGDRRMFIYKLREELYWNDDGYVRDRTAVYFRESLESITEIAIYQHHNQQNRWTLRITFDDPGAKLQVPESVLLKRAGGDRDSTFARGGARR